MSQSSLDPAVLRRLLNQSIEVTDSAMENRSPAAMLLPLLVATMSSMEINLFELELLNGTLDDDEAVNPNRKCRFTYNTASDPVEMPPPPAILYQPLRNLLVNATGMPKEISDEAVGYFRSNIGATVLWRLSARNGWTSMCFQKVELL